MNTPSHDDVARCARELWQSYGQPEGRDQEIWLEAERKLAAQAAPTQTKTAKASAPLDEKRLKAEMAAESVEEFNLDAGTSEQAAIKAALQTKKGATAPAKATSAPAAKPAGPAKASAPVKAGAQAKAGPAKGKKS